MVRGRKELLGNPVPEAGVARLRARTRSIEGVLGSRKGLGALIGVAGFVLFLTVVPGWFVVALIALGMMYLGARLYAADS